MLGGCTGVQGLVLKKEARVHCWEMSPPCSGAWWPMGTQPEAAHLPQVPPAAETGWDWTSLALTKALWLPWPGPSPRGARALQDGVLGCRGAGGAGVLHPRAPCTHSFQQPQHRQNIWPLGRGCCQGLHSGRKTEHIFRTKSRGVTAMPLALRRVHSHTRLDVHAEFI